MAQRYTRCPTFHASCTKKTCQCEWLKAYIQYIITDSRPSTHAISLKYALYDHCTAKTCTDTSASVLLAHITSVYIHLGFVSHHFLVCLSVCLSTHWSGCMLICLPACLTSLFLFPCCPYFLLLENSRQVPPLQAISPGGMQDKMYS